MADSPKETPKAADAFDAYVGLGRTRSLEKLARKLGKPSGYTRQLETWSGRYGWQDRIVAHRRASAEAHLNEAADLDADTFLATSRLLAERITLSTPLHVDAVVKVRESVRKPAPKGSTSVSVGVHIEVTAEQRQIAERVAAARGLTVDEVLAEAERVLVDAR